MFFIGISLERDAFKVAIVKKEKNAILIVDLHKFPYGPDHVKLFYSLPPFHSKISPQIVSGIASSDIFSRKLHIPLKEKRKILSTLPFQLESLLPFSEEKSIICPLFRPISKQMTSVTLFATLREKLVSHLQSLKDMNISSDTISCGTNALVRFGKWQFPNENKVLLFDFRDQKLTCILVEGHELILSQTLPICHQDQITIEIEKLAIFLKQKAGICDDTPWALTGDLEYDEIIKKIFKGRCLKAADPSTASFSVPIGLALDALKSDASTVRFSQGEFTPLKVASNRRKKIFTYLGACLGATLCIWVGGNLMLLKKQHILASKLQSYLPHSMQSSPLSTPEDIEGALAQWERSSKGQKYVFPFFPNVPKLSDVLAWISSHPALTTEEGMQKEGVEIKSFHYFLSKYPKIDDPSMPYLAQVELEFTSATPRIARDFHDTLLKGDAIVNSKKEVKWQTDNKTYHTSFELNKGMSQ